MCILVCFCLGFVLGVVWFFFCNKKDVYIFGNDRNVVQIYFCLCCSTVFFLVWKIILLLIRHFKILGWVGIFRSRFFGTRKDLFEGSVVLTSEILTFLIA